MSTSASVPSAMTVNVNPNDDAFALVISVPDGRINDTETVGSVVTMSKLFMPVVSASNVKGRSVELDLAGTTAPWVYWEVSCVVKGEKGTPCALAAMSWHRNTVSSDPRMRLLTFLTQRSCAHRIRTLNIAQAASQGAR
jgi:hypothetical protein